MAMTYWIKPVNEHIIKEAVEQARETFVVLIERPEGKVIYRVVKITSRPVMDYMTTPILETGLDYLFRQRLSEALYIIYRCCMKPCKLEMTHLLEQVAKCPADLSEVEAVEWCIGKYDEGA